MSLSFRALRAFIATLELQSMSRAAERLGISRSGTSHAVHDLERSLGVELFRRTPHGLKPTEAGLRLYERTRVHVLAIDRAADLAREEGRLHREEPIAFAAPHTLYRLYLLGLIESGARARTPSFRLLTRSFRESEEAVRSGEAQLGATILPIRRPEDFRVVPLGRVRCVFALSRRKFEALNRKRTDPNAPWTAREVLALPLITHPSASKTFRVAADFFRRTEGLALESSIEVHQLDIGMNLAEKELGAALTFADLMPHFPKLTALSADFALPEFEVVLIARLKTLSEPLERAMTDIAERFRIERARSRRGGAAPS